MTSKMPSAYEDIRVRDRSRLPKQVSKNASAEKTNEIMLSCPNETFVRKHLRQANSNSKEIAVYCAENVNLFRATFHQHVMRNTIFISNDTPKKASSKFLYILQSSIFVKNKGISVIALGTHM